MWSLEGKYHKSQPKWLIHQSLQLLTCIQNYRVWEISKLLLHESGSKFTNFGKEKTKVTMTSILAFEQCIPSSATMTTCIREEARSASKMLHIQIRNNANADPHFTSFRKTDSARCSNLGSTQSCWTMSNPSFSAPKVCRRKLTSINAEQDIIGEVQFVHKTDIVEWLVFLVLLSWDWFQIASSLISISQGATQWS